MVSASIEDYAKAIYAHGDPIPATDGSFVEAPSVSLGELEPGARGIFVRVSDSDPAVLRELAERGIRPGDAVEVVKARPTTRILCGAKSHLLRAELARAMRVEVEV